MKYLLGILAMCALSCGGREAQPAEPSEYQAIGVTPCQTDTYHLGDPVLLACGARVTEAPGTDASIPMWAATFSFTNFNVTSNHISRFCFRQIGTVSADHVLAIFVSSTAWDPKLGFQVMNLGPWDPDGRLCISFPLTIEAESAEDVIVGVGFRSTSLPQPGDTIQFEITQASDITVYKDPSHALVGNFPIRSQLLTIPQLHF